MQFPCFLFSVFLCVRSFACGTLASRMWVRAVAHRPWKKIISLPCASHPCTTGHSVARFRAGIKPCTSNSQSSGNPLGFDRGANASNLGIYRRELRVSSRIWGCLEEEWSGQQVEWRITDDCTDRIIFRFLS